MMRSGYGLFQQQATKVQMAPKLQQSLHVLQCSTPELLVMIEREVLDNPVLEFEGIDYDYDFAYPKKSASSREKGMFEDNFHTMDRLIWKDVSLEKHLLEQLAFHTQVPKKIQAIVGYLIGNLDAGGYLTLSANEAAAALHANYEDVELAIATLQSFEPAGVGARSVKECLQLQLSEHAGCTPLVAALVESHLDDIAYHRIRKLTSHLHADIHEIMQAIEVIKSLDPRPGAAYQQEDTRYIAPDIVVDAIGDAFAVHVRESAAPKLAINTQYVQMLQAGENAGDAQAFLATKRSAAQFLIRCIDQRRQTLLRVMQAIVEEQLAFFRQGAGHLRPLSLRQIAGKVGLHESTISRATAGKYVQTPWGIYELPYFFPNGLPADGGESASSDSVKLRIQELIRNENRAKPLSDQKLVALLLQEGVHISRRTVTKYREELGISSSVKRKWE